MKWDDGKILFQKVFVGQMFNKTSVTRSLEYLLNIWPFKIYKLAQKCIEFSKVG